MSRLIIATDGPCAGHPCDNCKICQSGRCCRNDNPHYKLPELGEWDGPIYGDLGILADDGERAECHCCGRWFGHLGSHIWQKHNLTPEEYRAIFGLNAKTSLIGPALAKKRADIMLAQPLRIEELKERGATFLRSATSEQHAAWAAKTRRLEHKIDPNVKKTLRVSARKARKTRQEQVAEKYWALGAGRDTPELLAEICAVLRQSPIDVLCIGFGAKTFSEAVTRIKSAGWPHELHRETYRKWLIKYGIRTAFDEAAQPLRRNRGKYRIGSSRFCGVSFNRSAGKWAASIRFNGKSHYLGVFSNDIDAARAYDRAARERYGPMAVLNFPDGAD